MLYKHLCLCFFNPFFLIFICCSKCVNTCIHYSFSYIQHYLFSVLCSLSNFQTHKSLFECKIFWGAEESASDTRINHIIFITINVSHFINVCNGCPSLQLTDHPLHYMACCQVSTVQPYSDHVYRPFSQIYGDLQFFQNIGRLGGK